MTNDTNSSLPERAFTVGTAGHVDHGKSTLVRALTGIDPDRLAEEKARAMTIDLGFAWLTLPGGQSVSVVDVPGHERFIKNMLAGVGGIDAALLIVAADEGPMPQTREHLAILDLLGITRGLIVLTKADTVEADFLALAEEATREAVVGTTFAEAPIVVTSATTGQGLDELKTALANILAAVPERDTHGRPRLPIDRAFTISGFGTVVTGTLLDGPLAVGQEVELLPRGIRGRVRGVQTHRTKRDVALPGSRVAVNISGVAVEDVRRGDVLTLPGAIVPTSLVDVRVRLTAGVPPLKQNDPVELFLGASEVPGRVTLLDAEMLDAGGAGFVQLRLAAPVVAVRGDRFILRRPSPGTTIGGGVVVDAAARRHRRFHAETLARLGDLERGTPADLVRQLVTQSPREVREVLIVLSHLGIESDAARLVLTGLLEAEMMLLPPGTIDTMAPDAFLMLNTRMTALERQLTLLLAEFHAAHPQRRGMPREEARARLGLPPRLFDALLTYLHDRGTTVAERAESGPTVRLATHAVTLSPAQRAAADRLLAALAASPFAPPDPATFDLTTETLATLADAGQIVRVAPGIVFARAAYDAMIRRTLDTIAAEGSITLAQFRDGIGTTRKYAQAVMEHFDDRRLTRRNGDARVRGPAARDFLTPSE